MRVRLALIAAGMLLAGGASAAQARHVAQAPPLDSRDEAPVIAGLQLDGENLHHCGNLHVHAGNWGLIGALPGSHAPFDAKPSGVWPAGARSEYLYGAGLWVGAQKGGVPVVSSVFPATYFTGEFQPGRDPRDRMYATHDGDPRGARLPNQNPDDDGDRRRDEDALNGRDDDGDGEVDEDYEAASDEMLVCEYNDFDPRIRFIYGDHVPLGLRVRQRTMCWSVPAVDDFIAFDYEILHTGDAWLDDLYVGFYADFDCGPRDRGNVASDDRAGFWEGYVPLTMNVNGPSIKVAMTYMFDADGDDGATDGWMALVYLGASGPNYDGLPRRYGLHNARVFAGGGTFAAGGDPTTDAERYRCLDGTAPRSLPAVHPDTGLRPASRTPRNDDYSVAISAGPFPSVRPGDVVRFQFALVAGRGFEDLVVNAVQAALTYEGFPYDCDGNPSSGHEGRESPVCAPATGSWFKDRCDLDCVLDPLTCLLRVPDQGCIWINDDCEEEARTHRITGEYGMECRLPWFAQSAPQAPPMRAVTSENRVDVLWDDSSESARDPVTGRPDFEAFRIWRASGWTRPPGSDVRTGPAAGAWQLLAEFDRPDNGVGNDTGFESIRYVPVTIAEESVEFYRRWIEQHPGQTPPDLAGMSPAQRDTALALARGKRYYRFVDPPFLRQPILGDPCAARTGCLPIRSSGGLVPARCNDGGRCQATMPPPHSGTHLFYAVTATDTGLECDSNGCRLIEGLANGPTANFVYVNPPTTALAPENADRIHDLVYVVPNPVTRAALEGWRLAPVNDDPTGIKLEFHHLPRARGHVTVFTLAGDRVVTLPFDGTGGNGTLAWDLLSRNGQEIASGVYLYVVESTDARFRRVTGKFTVIR